MSKSRFVRRSDRAVRGARWVVVYTTPDGRRGFYFVPKGDGRVVLDQLVRERRRAGCSVAVFTNKLRKERLP